MEEILFTVLLLTIDPAGILFTIIPLDQFVVPEPATILETLLSETVLTAFKLVKLQKIPLTYPVLKLFTVRLSILLFVIEIELPTVLPPVLFTYPYKAPATFVVFKLLFITFPETVEVVELLSSCIK